MLRSDARIGMRVVFGRAGERAEKSFGKIIKINPKTALVETLEQRGMFKMHDVGSKYHVPYYLIEPAPENGDKSEVVIKGKVKPVIVPGVTTFRATHADSRPLWKVIRGLSKESYLCEVVTEIIEIGDGKTIESDWGGTQKAFLTQEILGSISMDQLFDEMNSEHNQFYMGLSVGQTVHYHNGFNNWVRCVVVAKDGENVLKPIAMLGPWASHDLPHRQRDGEISWGYYPNKIRTGETFTPNYSNIYEANNKLAKGIPPTHLLPINLDPPTQTPDEITLAALWVKVKQIEGIISKEQDPSSILEKIRKLI